jgi:hypothetical protein
LAAPKKENGVQPPPTGPRESDPRAGLAQS